MQEFLDFLKQLFSKDGVQDLIVRGGYVALGLIVFAETGLLIGFFLPGDSLLVTTGLLIKTGAVQMEILMLNFVLIVCAILGDATGYFIGRRAGHKLYDRPNSRLFKREHLMKTHEFYEKHGGKTIILARFIPVVRTFAPVVAGAAGMEYKKFAVFNIMGAVLWIVSTTFLGYALGSMIPADKLEKYIYVIIGLVIFISILPPVIEILRARKAKKEIVTEGKSAV